MIIDWDKYPLPVRYRHHVSGNLYLPLKELKITPHNYPPLIDKLDWSDHFADGNPPKRLDIGCGFGRFMIEFATEYSEDNILGIEVRSQAVEYAKNVIKKEDIGNCSIIWYSVVNGIDFIDDNSIKQIFYFFPDPWFKTKHYKRRAFDQNFLQFCHQKLMPGGELLLQTDIKEVHQYHIDELESFGNFDYKELAVGKDKWNLPTTNKENECIKKGFDYYRLKALKSI